ncbi:MAG: hypothetical protein JWM34_3918 [Ilumatobacteraceae bacterium]|nr:hypothetical protein [Ilumatobacteraceae bacterium]
MPTKRPCRGLAAYVDAVDGSASIESLRWICLAVLEAAVVDRPVSEALVGVEIDASACTVVHDEVPWPIVTPRIQPIDPDASENGDHLLELCRLQPEVEIRMSSGLLTEQCVDCPSATEAHIDSSVTECSQQFKGGLGIHDMVMHRLEPTEPIPAERRHFATKATEHAAQNDAPSRLAATRSIGASGAFAVLVESGRTSIRRRRGWTCRPLAMQRTPRTPRSRRGVNSTDLPWVVRGRTVELHAPCREFFIDPVDR